MSWLSSGVTRHPISAHGLIFILTREGNLKLPALFLLSRLESAHKFAQPDASVTRPSLPKSLRTGSTCRPRLGPRSLLSRPGRQNHLTPVRYFGQI